MLIAEIRVFVMKWPITERMKRKSRGLFKFSSKNGEEFSHAVRFKGTEASKSKFEFWSVTIHDSH